MTAIIYTVHPHRAMAAIIYTVYPHRVMAAIIYTVYPHRVMAAIIYTVYPEKWWSLSKNRFQQHSIIMRYNAYFKNTFQTLLKALQSVNHHGGNYICVNNTLLKDTQVVQFGMVLCAKAIGLKYWNSGKVCSCGFRGS